VGWKATGRPTVRQHRGRWVVRIEGIDTETGSRRPRQLGTYPSQRAARNAAADAIATSLGEGAGYRGADPRSDTGRHRAAVQRGEPTEIALLRRAVPSAPGLASLQS
jgi:hypothetical protein